MAAMFPLAASYHNYVPADAVRNCLASADSAARTKSEHMSAAATLRKMALAHSLAAAAARVGLWRPHDGQLYAAADLSTAAGQLYLRAARHEELHLSGSDGYHARVLRDRTDASTEFLLAHRQAIAAGALTNLPDPRAANPNADDTILQLHTAIWEAIRSGGQPDLAALTAFVDAMDAPTRDTSPPEFVVTRVVGRYVAEALARIARALQEGHPDALSPLGDELVTVNGVLEQYTNGEVADLVASYAQNLSWLSNNSVWRLPGEMKLSIAELGSELVAWLLRNRKPFLFPGQWGAIRESCVLSTKQMNVLSMPTGSGKSLLAELLVLQHLSLWSDTGERGNQKAFYIVPSRALAREKMAELRDLFDGVPSIGATVCQLTGDILLDAETAIRRYDVIVATPEKFDMVLRAPNVRALVGAVVVDEFHNIRDGARGLRLLSILSRLQRMTATRGARLHLVSAVVSQSDLKLVVDWLDAPRAQDEPRGRYHRTSEPPIFTRCGVFDFEVQRRADSRVWRIDYDDGTTREVPGTIPSTGRWRRNQQTRAAYDLALKLASDGGPSMVFATSATWRWSNGAMHAPPVDTAVELSKSLGSLPDWVNREASEALADGLRRLWGDHPLVKAAKTGVAVHWGSMPLRGRRLVEEAVAHRGVALLVATSTLAEGVNLPLRRLIIPKCTLHGQPFPIGFFLNLKGRAGRPFLTDEGEVILVASHDTPLEVVQALMKVTADDVERLESALPEISRLRRESQATDSSDESDEDSGVSLRELEDALDSAVLAAVSEQPIAWASAVTSLVGQFTLAHQDDATCSAEVQRSLDRLSEWTLVERSVDQLAATPRGASVYRCGFAPRDAVRTRDALGQGDRIEQLLFQLPETPADGSARAALETVFELLEATGIWSKITRAGVRKPAQAAMFLHDWVSGKPLARVAADRRSDRLYLHSLLEGTLAPAAAWFFFALASVVTDGFEPHAGSEVLAKRFEAWAEFSFFGAPPGPALSLMKADFEGRWHRDDALRVCDAFAAKELKSILKGRSDSSVELLEGVISDMVPDTVEPPEAIARALLGAFATDE